MRSTLEDFLFLVLLMLLGIMGLGFGGFLLSLAVGIV